MADQQLNIRLNAIDNASKAFVEVKNSIFNVRNALVGLGAGVVVKSLVDIGKKAEDARARLNILAGDVNKGGRAFDQFTTFAIRSKVPLEDVIASSRKLLALGSAPERLAKNLEIISNISAQTGLSFETTVDQFSKSTTKGLNSARIFADENIKILLGIPQNVELSGRESLKVFEKDFSGSGRFGQANKNIKNTLSGTIIGLKNILFSFSSDVSQGFFEVLKKQLGDLEVFFGRNKDEIIRFAQALGKGLANAILAVKDGIIFLKDNFEFIKNVVIGIIILQFAKWLYAVGVAVSGLAIATRTLTIAMLANPLFATASLLATGIALVTGAIISGKDATNAWSQSIDTLGDEMSSAFGNGEKMTAIGDSAEQNIKPWLVGLKQIDEPFEDFLSKMENEPTFLDEILEKFDELNPKVVSLSETIAKGMVKGIDDFSTGLAESIVLGKDLQTTLKGVAQKILVDILSAQLKVLANLAIQLIREKLITQEKITQATISSGSSLGGGFLGTIARIGFNAIAGGGSVPLDAPNLYNPIEAYAEGGSVRGGMPITVGERGRELFVPSTNGTIVPNHDMGGGMNINFNIQANDVRGIKELLIDNRATIINLVNQGANQKGKSNVV